MVRYECDMCRCEVGSTEERYQIKLESTCVTPPSALVEESDADCVEEMAEQLDDGDTVEIPMVLQPLKKTFDLCRACFVRYGKNPLGVERQRQYTVRRN